MFNLNKEESFAKREERILKFWQDDKIFEKSVDSRKDKKLFSFYDGPPFATGLPHYGNLLASVLKDIIPRYKTMKGFYVPRRFGWDCHGLPVENEIEKANELSGHLYVSKFGIAAFNEECEKIVLRYTKEWKKTINRIGRWVDFSNTYKTMDLSYMESVWWVFKQLYDQDLIYEGFKVMPFSAKLGTPLSNFEANLNYQEVDDPSLVVKFQMLKDKDTYFLAWTTTPWTLISNLALAVHPDIEYAKVKDKKTNKNFILAKERVSNFFKDDFEIISTFKGIKLKDEKYIPLFDYFSDQKDAFRVLVDDFVDLEEGTGIVHTAPAFGEVDFYVCKKERIELVCPVDSYGRFTKEIKEYENKLVKDCDKLIIRRLKEEGKIFLASTIRHRYPFCWRTDTPLIYKAVKTWFVAVEKIKDKLIEANKKIHWVPEHIKDGRFGKWLENARDWAISRNRFWGTPIPIWRDQNNNIVVMDSIKELEKKTNKKVTNLHRQFIDDLTFEHQGSTYKRIDEVFDCWFESGSMPYAQNHYPFENKEMTETSFPADFIAEGLDQTRGWFYTLNVISSAIFNKPAFKNVIVNGIILAEDGNKMSKRLKNYPEPELLISKYGADAIRLYMLHSPAVKGEDLKFTEKGVSVILRQILLPFWNSYVFLATYANIYKWTPTNDFKDPKADIDRWIISLLNKLISDVEIALDKYELNKAIDPIVEFIEHLTNWYIRRSRTRFWADEDTQDRKDAFFTLHHVILTLSKITAPFVVFISDAIYKELKTDDMPTSVHLCDWPTVDKTKLDIDLVNQMDYVQRSVSIGHALRKEYKLKVRQPLAKAYIEADIKILNYLEKQKHLIEDELNVKEVVLLKDESRFIKLEAKPNFRTLGKKVQKLLPKAQKIIQNFTQDQMNLILNNQIVEITIDDQKITLTSDDVVIDRKVKEGVAAFRDKDIAVALDTTITDDLFEEAIAREIVNKINLLRKEKNFNVTDRIHVIFDSTDLLKKSYEKHKKYIDHEILATIVRFEKCEGSELDINGQKTTIEITQEKK
ncbi:MAG: Isoleucine--tRNA ligase [Candidatus Anoxychlamydiales bacterium]|nr:Isoleucine--tRNA ligase [Candidatus Anoxychlamydiales bacterium]